MRGETLGDCLYNAKQQLKRATKALELARAIQATFPGPRVEALDASTVNTTSLLVKLLRDDVAIAQKHVDFIEAELAKRKVSNVA